FGLRLLDLVGQALANRIDLGVTSARIAKAVDLMLEGLQLARASARIAQLIDALADCVGDARNSTEGRIDDLKRLLGGLPGRRNAVLLGPIEALVLRVCLRHLENHSIVSRLNSYYF